MAHPYDETLGLTALMINQTISAETVLTLIIATHSNINTSDPSSPYHYKPYPGYRTLHYRIYSHSFGIIFIDPLHLRPIDPIKLSMSCYAFFKRWLPLGQLFNTKNKSSLIT